NRDVQRLLGAMQLRSIKANKAVLITTSDFTIQAKEQAKEAPIELWNGNYLIEIVEKYMQD
ncbi:MAG: restriction endonuclease, partial [Planctomycetes bacterium]|nr:restriction endonuclease [Planctomycetota bacterium]